MNSQVGTYIIGNDFFCRSGWGFVGVEFSNTGGIDQPDGLVLLCFQSCRKELCECLLESPVAVQLAADGVLLQPDFAAGRLILAKGVTEARGPWHLAEVASSFATGYLLLHRQM